MSNPPFQTVRTTVWAKEVDIRRPIQDLYLGLFNHPLDSVICRSIDNNSIAIVLEKSTTLPEQTLLSGGYCKTASAFRQQLEAILKKNLKLLLTDLSERPVTDIFSEYQPETGNTSLIAVFGAAASQLKHL
ncbi:MAG: Na-translocating system protein MpsC family protein [Cyanobacteria bacterium P01_A01_bin.114]